MLKQIEICGQRFELYRPDKGRTWSSSPRSIVAYGQSLEAIIKKKITLKDLQKLIPRKQQ